uniref:Uncharacterized protein n=1 Tax=Oryza punctata TaxID=4537 RepID=A0A0E0JVN4_ORYPU
MAIACIDFTDVVGREDGVELERCKRQGRVGARGLYGYGVRACERARNGEWRWRGVEEWGRTTSVEVSFLAQDSGWFYQQLS